MGKYVSSVLERYVVLTAGIGLGYVSFLISNIVYNEHKHNFVDEIFHVPQAQRFCHNQWNKWDPKITTLPGLYLVSLVLLKPFHFLGFSNFCSLYALRMVNILATVINFFVTYGITCSLEDKYPKFKSKFYFKLLTALNVALFPPLYFFTFLYYTDVWSVTFVLLMYYFHLQDGKLCKILGGISGLLSVLMRQNNIIWVGLMVLDDMWTVFGEDVKGAAVQDLRHVEEVCVRFYSKIPKQAKVPRKLLYIPHKILKKSSFHIAICILFVLFVVFNGGIVVGDRNAHAVTFHPMQNLYFLDFLAFFGWPFLISEIRSLWKERIGVFSTVCLLGFCAALSEFNKLEHPYLLADNRHLAFYLWKRVFGHEMRRRVIVPTYVFSGILSASVLQKRCLVLFTVLLSVCTMLYLTPQYLFELRYFIIPFIFFRLQFKQSKVVFVETIFYIGINFGVVYLFLTRPFFWPNEPDTVQRIIW